MGLSVVHDTFSVRRLIAQHKRGNLNLSPVFQRDSVWTLGDRRRLIASMFDGIPLPSIFLYRGEKKHQLDVIDGKQRLETILYYMGSVGFEDNVFVATNLDEGAVGRRRAAWTDIPPALQSDFLDIELPVIEVQGDLDDVLNLFVAINSTGRKLVKQEIRRAKFGRSALLQTANAIADEETRFFLDQGVFTKSQVSRQRHVEFCAEMLVTLDKRRPLNKKSEMDSVIANSGDRYTPAELRSLRKALKRAIRDCRQILPNLATVRFRHSSELYSLLFVLSELRVDGAVLDDPRSQKLANGILTQFSVDIDEVAADSASRWNQPKTVVPTKYRTLASKDTDSRKTRMGVQRILRELLEDVFVNKDARRQFNETQRRLIWHSANVKNCAVCKTRLTWKTFEADHIRPHAKGGKTALDNAQLLCGPCNRAKSAR